MHALKLLVKKRLLIRDGSASRESRAFARLAVYIKTNVLENPTVNSVTNLSQLYCQCDSFLQDEEVVVEQQCRGEFANS